MVEPLVRDNIVPATRLLELRRQMEQARGDGERAAVSIAQAGSGMAELEGSLGVAREALAADPTGQSLGVTGDAVNSACARIPTLP